MVAVSRRISDSSFNVSALSQSRVSTPKGKASTPKIGSKRAKKRLAAAAAKCRRLSNKKGTKRRQSAVDNTSSDQSTLPLPPPAKKPRLPAGNSMVKSVASLGDLFRNDHHVAMRQSSPPEALLATSHPPPPQDSRTVIEIGDSSDEEQQEVMEEGELVSTLVEEVGHDLLALVQPAKTNLPPTPRTIIRDSRAETAPPHPQTGNETITLDDTAEGESRASSPGSVIEILGPDVIVVDQCLRRGGSQPQGPPAANIQSIAAKYYTPPAMDYIPLSDNRTRPMIRPSWAEAAARGAGRGRRTVGRGPHNGDQVANVRGSSAAVTGARFATSTAAGRRPDFQFGGPAPPPGQVFRFTGRGGQSETAETMYSVSSSRAAQVGLRPIVIDGSNVAMSHGRSSHFSVQGIQLVIDYFKERGHTRIVAFLPEYRKKSSMSTDPKLLDRLEKEGYVVCTPSRETDTARIASYDDKFILDYAAKNGGVVVTRDNYKDLIREKVEWREVIERRLLMPTFPDKDSVMFPDDPLGRHGPRLAEFLSF